MPRKYSFKLNRLNKASPLSLGIIVMFAVIMTYFLVNSFAASGSATLYTSPAGNRTVQNGQSFTVSVRISSGPSVPITGASVYLSYPDSLLQVTGESYSGSPYTTQLLVSNSGGVLRMDRAAFPMISGGDQLFAQVSFKAIGTGTASVGFTSSSLVTSGEDDSNILGQKTGVSYTITAPSSPPPSSGGGDGGTASGSGDSSSGGDTSTASPPSDTTPQVPAGSTSSGSSTDGSSGDGSNDTAGSGSGTSTGSTGTATDSPGTDEVATSSVKITVVDKDGKPVEGAEVQVSGQTVRTDKNGAAYFNNVPVGTQPIIVTYNGKKTSKNLAIKDIGEDSSPQLLKVSITRNKFNPVLLIIPAFVLVMAALLLLRPWDRWLALSVAEHQEVSPVISSDHPASHLTPSPQPTIRPHDKEMPGMVYAPNQQPPPEVPPPQRPRE